MTFIHDRDMKWIMEAQVEVKSPAGGTSKEKGEGQRKGEMVQMGRGVGRLF